MGGFLVFAEPAISRVSSPRSESYSVATKRHVVWPPAPTRWAIAAGKRRLKRPVGRHTADIDQPRFRRPDSENQHNYIGSDRPWPTPEGTCHSVSHWIGWPDDDVAQTIARLGSGRRCPLLVQTFLSGMWRDFAPSPALCGSAQGRQPTGMDGATGVRLRLAKMPPRSSRGWI